MSRILVIDDNDLIGGMLKEALTEHGYEAKVAMDANSGYATAVDFRPDLMLVDVQLPDALGFDLVRAMKNREELRAIPIIMITGTANKSEEKVKGFQLGADDYVIKPFDMPELLERIRALLRRSQSPGRPLRQDAPSIVSAPYAPPARKELPRPSLQQALTTILIAPWSFPPQLIWPPVTFFCLSAALGLSLGGLALSAGATANPAAVGVGVVGLWGGFVVVLVVACSLLGISLDWREGASIISLAASPLLLKLAGAVVSTFCTTLSPFYFTASPALFWEQAPEWVSRLDLFEFWAVLLVGHLVRRRPGASRQKARVIMLCLWSVGGALAMGLAKMGNP